MLDAGSHVNLLAADDELRSAVPAADHSLATRGLTLPGVRIERGAWAPPASSQWDAPVAGLLLLEGFLMRETALGDRTATELYGPGDVVDPWRSGGELLPCAVTWMALQPARLAVLERRFALCARRWPGLAAILAERVAARADRLAVHVAILQLSPVERRVLGVMWQIAERWGRVTPEGIVVPLSMTHQLLGRFVGAQRPTVTLAVQALASRGALARRQDGTWLLAEHTRAELEPERGDAEVAVLTPAR